MVFVVAGNDDCRVPRAVAVVPQLRICREGDEPVSLRGCLSEGAPLSGAPSASLVGVAVSKGAAPSSIFWKTALKLSGSRW